VTAASAEDPSRALCIGVKHLVVALLLNWKFVPSRTRFVVSFAGAAGAIAMGLVATGCNSLYTAPTTAVPTTSQFSTALVAPGGSTVSTFNLSTTTTVGITLVSVVSNATGQVLAPTMQLVLGTPTSATTCSPVTAKGVTPALAAQIQTSLSAGAYCVEVLDLGLSEPGIVSVRINSSNAAPTNISTPTNVDLFSSTVGPRGSATHQLAVFFNGATTLTLASAGAAVTVGVSYGAWDGQTCRFFATLNAAASANPLLSTAVDPGNYCIRVFDVGQLTAPILFTLDTVHP
jgi:hypothetical protein